MTTKKSVARQTAQTLKASAVPMWEQIMLRGGRLIKMAGQTVSLSPSLGRIMGAASISVAALSGLATISGGQAAFAGTCTEVGGIATCSGASDAATDSEQFITVATTVTEDGFGIESPSGDGIDLSYSGTSDLTFTDLFESTISTGGYYGILADNNGTGALSITSTGSVSSSARFGYGIEADNSVNGTDLTLSVVDVTGAYGGILADNNGSGALSITSTGTVTGSGYEGIEAINEGTDLTISVVDVTSDSKGIDARNNGSGSLSISSTGNITAAGLSADGIYAYNFGAGGVTITSTGSVSGERGGIYVDNSASGTYLTIEVADVTGGNRGIGADNYGSGALSITSTGTVTGRFNGIDAGNSANGTDLTIDVVNVAGASNGINADNDGSGALTITSTGSVTATDFTAEGIRAFNEGTDLTISAFDVAGEDAGIQAENNGSGTLSITTTGTVMGDYGEGIDADNNGAGALSITSTGTVTSARDDGISANNSADGTDLTVSVEDVTGDDNGISASNNGTGTLSITSTGTVIGTDDDGITAVNAGTDLTITAVDVAGGKFGIEAESNGSGALSITTTGTVTGASYDGINADNNGEGGLFITSTGSVTGDDFGILGNTSANGTEVIISAVDVTGRVAGITGASSGSGLLSITSTGTVTATEGNGIYALNNGTDGLSITSTGSVIGGGDDGIYAFNTENATDLTIEVADVTGDFTGINAGNAGSGAFSITSTGTVAGVDSFGIRASNAGTDFTISVVDVAAEFDGIEADNNGTGALSITSTGTVAATHSSFNGIEADNSANGTDLTISVVDVIGGSDGIRADNYGSGALSITSTGTVTTTSFEGIDAANSNNGTDLTIDVVDVVAGSAGIDADNKGAGALSITSTGTVTSTRDDGIDAHNSADGTDLTISAVNVTSDANGIYTSNYGSGVLTITSTGTVTSGNYGIFALNSTTSTEMTIDAVDVTGGTDGIIGINRGSGTLSINTTGTVTGTYGHGIYAYNEGTGGLSITSTGSVSGSRNGVYAVNKEDATDLTIAVTDVTGGMGIRGYNLGSGAVSIKSTGTVTSASSFGIRFSNSGTDLTISVVDVAAEFDGIEADNDGTGALSITSTGTVTATHSSFNGIEADNAGTDLTITAVDVSGGSDGIRADNDGSGALTITSTGTVTGTSFEGIDAYNSANGTDLTISVVDVSGGDEGIQAVNNGSGDLSISVAGAVTSGSASYSINATTNAGQSSAITLEAGAYVGSYGLAILTGEGDTTVLVETGATVDGRVNLGTGDDSLTLDSGATWIATNGASSVGSLTNSGTITAVDGAADDTISASGDFVGGGTLAFDVDFETATSDTLVIGGDVTSTSATVISVNDVSTGEASGESVVLVDVAGSTDDDDFALAGGSITAGAFDYVLDLSANQWILLAEINSTGATYEGFATALAGYSDLSSLQQRVGARQWLSADGEQGAWFNVAGTVSQGSLVSSSNSSYEINTFEGEGGYDIRTDFSDNGTWVFGVSGQYGTSNTNLSFDDGAGSIDATGYGIAATATWYGNDSMYADFQGQFTWIESDIASSTSGALVNGHDSTAYALSAEIGQRLSLANGGTIIPQAQLTLAGLDGDSFTDSAGSDVAFDVGDKLTARVGLAYELDIESLANSNGTAYVIGNLEHTQAEDTAINVGGDILNANADGSWFEIGAGGAISLDDSKVIFAEASYKRGIDSTTQGNDSFGLSAGLQFDW